LEIFGMPGLAHVSEIPQKTIDLLVVGLGPAGISCALQAFRDGLEVLAVGDEPIGGLVRAGRKLTNLPGLPSISGGDLAGKLEGQLQGMGVATCRGHVSSIERRDRLFLATLADGREISARAVCLATGTRPRDWDVSVGGQPVHRDARSLPESIKGGRVVVIGGGEAALDTALSARDRGAEVLVLVRGERLQAVAGLIGEAGRRGVEVRLKTRVARVTGGPGKWVLTCSGLEPVSAQHLVVCIGRVPRDELIAELIVGGFEPEVEQKSLPGLFLAGDLIRGRDRYVATAMGDGQRAAVAAAAYSQEVANGSSGCDR
jgi:thioredoxin reductase (NADPH)